MSKYLALSLLTALMITACSSKDKKADAAKPAAKAATTKSADPAKDAAKDSAAGKDAGKAAAGKSAAPSKPAAKDAATSGGGTGGGGEAGETVTCKNGSDERTLALTEANGGCELTYTKFGNAQQVATSGNGKEYCENVREKIKTKLEGAGFSCQ
jgi:hypothetical protein